MVKRKFKELDYLLVGDDGGKEWVKADFIDLLRVFKEALCQFPKTEMCFGGKRYKLKNGIIKEYKLPNCRLDLLGILDGSVKNAYKMVKHLLYKTIR